MLSWIGLWEVLLVLGLLLLFFGGRRIPRIARGLGLGIRNLKGEMGRDEGREIDVGGAEGDGIDADRAGGEGIDVRRAGGDGSESDPADVERDRPGGSPPPR